MTTSKRRKMLSKELAFAREQLIYIDTSHFDALKLAKFEHRKRIIDLYIDDRHTLKEISEITHTSISEIKRLANRFLTTDDNGTPYGYVACIPNSSLKQYSKFQNNERGYAGLFTQFLDKYPVIQEELEKWALGKSAINGSVIRGKRYLRIYEAFRSLCVECGINVTNQYPFTNADGGLDAVRNYCIQVKHRSPNRGVVVDFGDDAGMLYNTSSVYEGESFPPRPYDVVELDGHLVDVELIIQVINELNEFNDLLLSRIWILCLVDTVSKAVLGYSISLLHNYSSHDVLNVIACALTTSGSAEKHDGLPCTEVPGCNNRLFNIIKLDNAYAHTSPWVHEKIIEAGAQEIILNRAKRPRSNKIIERFFGTFEELSGHRLCSTTGSKPDDERRRNPDKAAVKHKITLEIIEKAAHMAVAEYNSSPHSALNGSTPLEYLAYCIQKDQDFIRQLPPEEVHTSQLYTRKIPVTVRGNLSIGKPPYIQFKGATYSSETLKKRPDLISEKATIEIDSRDIRFAKLFLENGLYLGKLIVERRWYYYPHTVKTRGLALRRYRERKKSHRVNSTNPIEDYLSDIAEKSKKGRKQRNDLARLSRETGISLNQEKPKSSSRKTNIPNGYKVSLNRIIKY